MPHLVLDLKQDTQARRRMPREDYKNLQQGKIIAGRWKIVEKLGEGGMGAVYMVEDKKRKNFKAAMKVEDDLYEGGVLKLEVFILQQLQKMKDTVKLYDAGKRKMYNFMVMTLCGKDLMTLKRQARKPFCEQTTLRLAISTLYAIKQVGIDVSGCSSDFLCLWRIRRARGLFSGMARSFVAKDENGKLAIRAPREGDQLFRGTPRYCSLNTHYRKEQGRVDDLWAWLHMLIELHIGLPWNRLIDEKEILAMKEKTKPPELIRTCPFEFYKIRDYLETLKYEDRPDYYGLFSECATGLKRVQGSFLDRFEWEGPPDEVVAGTWKIVDKLGQGGMGAVYKVESKKRKNFMAAMKVEDDLYQGGVLKLEVHVLQELQKRRDTVRLFDAGQRRQYNFMVMSLCGKDLMTLKRTMGRPFSERTILRVAITTLYALKQVHECGFVHRDVKPGNFLVGLYGRDRRMIYLVDFGMARSFIAKDEDNQLAIRAPRQGRQLFRGTPRYCSMNTHYRMEQTCPEEFYKIREYLETLKYEDRPDYHGLFSECFCGLKRVHGSFLENYEWEDPPDEMNTALSISESAETGKPLPSLLQNSFTRLSENL
ncbi:unnamed protein product [Nippostrongylus brasiliensis]|uniref:non-specific serine/threonine protein kinase n=1 Tax=Nippostrongylus brasiliensis TaxID=27835 RepID=A0A0N4Y3R3_NIPBR|nr:unnamed protein product [Nippostrongylus brasiliensis]